jgi:hypothetical protein
VCVCVCNLFLAFVPLGLWSSCETERGVTNIAETPSFLQLPFLFVLLLFKRYGGTEAEILYRLQPNAIHMKKKTAKSERREERYVCSNSPRALSLSFSSTCVPAVEATSTRTMKMSVEDRAMIMTEVAQVEDGGGLTKRSLRTISAQDRAVWQGPYGRAQTASR